MNSKQAQPPTNESHNLGFLEIAVLLLSIYVIGALLVQTIFPLSPEVSLLLDRLDVFVCAVFLTDFLVRFRRAPSKLAFLKWGWIDLISSIPVYDVLRWGRIVRVIRIIRILRAFRSVRHLATFLFRRRTQSLAFTAILTALLLIMCSSIAVLAFENAPNSSIRAPFDAVWWSVSTMTTVGYGDCYPVTTAGRIVAMILMIFGVGLFGVLTGLFARLFVGPDLKREDEHIKTLIEETRRLHETVARLEARLDSQNRDSPPPASNA